MRGGSRAVGLRPTDREGSGNPSQVGSDEEMVFPSTKENLSEEDALGLIRMLNLPLSIPVHVWEKGMSEEEVERARRQQEENERIAERVKRQIHEKRIFVRLVSPLVPGLSSDLVYDHVLIRINGMNA